MSKSTLKYGSKRNANRIAKLTLDEVCNELRSAGYSIRFYAFDPLTYEVISCSEHKFANTDHSNGTAYCLRTEEGLRGILNGQDHWLESIGALAKRINA